MLPDHANVCLGQEKQVQNFLDGALPPKQEKAFRGHLAHCQACQSHLKAYQFLFDNLAEFEQEALQPPPGIVAKVMNNLPPPRSDLAPIPLKKWPLWLMPSLALQLMIGLGLLGLWWPSLSLAFKNSAFLQELIWLNSAQLHTELWLWTAFIQTELETWYQIFWPTLSSTLSLKLTPNLAFGLLFLLSLAWFIGNALLLKSPIPLFKKGKLL